MARGLIYVIGTDYFKTRLIKRARLCGVTGLGSSLTGAAKVWWKRNKLRHSVGQIHYIFTVEDMGARLEG